MVPRLYYEEYFLARRRLVEEIARASSMDEVRDLIHKNSPLLAPTVATCGPAGVNAAPFMLSFMVKEEYLGDALAEMKKILEGYYGQGWRAMAAATRFLLDYVYNPEKADPMRLVSHLMAKGHTWRNIVETGEATISILLPPDRGALELRTRVRIVEEGPVYEYVNVLHDLIHVSPEGERHHPWYPAVVFEIVEVYDNSYQRLGLRIYPPARIIVAAGDEDRVYLGHFGDAARYLVYEFVDGECVLVEERKNPFRGEHEHGEEGKRRKILELIGDAQFIVSGAFGPGGEEFFHRHGIRVAKAKPGTPVKEALEKLFHCSVRKG